MTKKQIVWKQEKNNIDMKYGWLHGVIAGVAYLVLACGIMGLADKLFVVHSAKVSMRFVCILLVTTFTICLWNEGVPYAKQKKKNLIGNGMILLVLGVILWINYLGEPPTSIDGIKELGITYRARWDAHSSAYVPRVAGKTELMKKAVELLLLVMFSLFQVIGGILRKKSHILMLPLGMVCMGLMVVCSPEWKPLAILTMSCVLLLYLDSCKQINWKNFLSLTLVSLVSLLLMGTFQKKAEELVFSWNIDWFQFQEKAETYIKKIQVIDIFSDEDKVDNSTPVLKDEQMMVLSMSEKPTKNIYLRGYHCNNYVDGVWKKDINAFRDACNEYGISEAEASKELLNIIYESESSVPNTCVDYELTYTDIRNKYCYLPYGSGWEEDDDEYRFTQDSIIGKKKSKKEAKAYSWQELRYLDESAILCLMDNTLEYRFDSGYSSANLTEEQKKLSDWYEEFVYENYLELPQQQEVLTKFAQEVANNLTFGSFDFEGDIESIYFGTNPETINTIRIEAAYILAAWFKKVGRYSLELDTLPLGQDAIDYFLETSKEGYCVHFASAGTLLLRRLGIPARYVVGYLVKPDAVEYQDGKYTASVLDSDAHAWTEIYLQDYGWVPVEMTPGYMNGTNQKDRYYQTIYIPEEGGGSVATPKPNTEQSEPEDLLQDEEEKVPEESETQKETGTDKGNEGERDSKETGNDSEGRNQQKSGKLWMGMGLVLVVILAGGVIYWRLVNDEDRKNGHFDTYIKSGQMQKAICRINEEIYHLLVSRNRKYSRVKDEELLEGLKLEFPEVEESCWDTYFDVVRRAVYSKEKITTEEVKECYRLYRCVRESGNQNEQEGREKE